MQVMGAGSGLLALTFPHDDLVFGQRVREILNPSTARDANEARKLLTRRLSPVYPAITTVIRNEVAGFGDPLVYVYRDGSARSNLTDAWIDDTTTARVVTDATGVYVDANEQAAALFGVERESIIGAAAGTFTRQDSRIEDAAALWRALRDTGRLHSLALVRCSDDTEKSVEFVTLRDGDGPDRNATYLRQFG
jgi:PAS domain S-box-containing protein